MNDRMTIAEALAELASYGPAVWLGVLAAVATFVIEAVLCAKGILFSGGERKLERARKAGNVVQGVLKTCRYRDGNRRARRQTACTPASMRIRWTG